jgi:hypothetical protein
MICPKGGLEGLNFAVCISSFYRDWRRLSLLAAKMKAKAAIGGDKRPGDGAALYNVQAKSQIVLSSEDLASAFVRPLLLCLWMPELYGNASRGAVVGGDRRRNTVARPIALQSKSASRLCRRLWCKNIRKGPRAFGRSHLHPTRFAPSFRPSCCSPRRSHPLCIASAQTASAQFEGSENTSFSAVYVEGYVPAKSARKPFKMG